MNILFLNPPFLGRFSRTSRSPAVTKGGTFYYPIWLAYATGWAQHNGHDARLFDAPARLATLDDLYLFLEDWQPGLVVVDTSTPSIHHDSAVAARIKERFPASFILLVGTHPSALPEESLSRNPAIDGVAIGEYDATVVELAGALEHRQPLEPVQGLALRRAGEPFLTAPREKLEHLDALPFVSRVYLQHLNVRDYFFAAANYPMVMIITGRGCPHRCFFCVYPQVFHSRRYRVRSARNVVDELAYIQTHLPMVKEVGIEDDCFTASPAHVRGICEEIIRRRLRLKWYCNVRGDVKPELLALMKKAGCRLVTVGFESGAQSILDAMGKGITLEKYRRFVQDVKQAGLLVHGCMMVGNPGDTRETLAASYRFAIQADCDSMQFYPLYVYPGTEAFEWAKSNGYLTTTDYARWLDGEGQHNCVLETPQLSSREMVALCDDYLRRYHLRPRYLLKKLWQAVRDPAEGYRSLLSAQSFFWKLLRNAFLERMK
ncbi:hopanoid biosynthesis associated radical SAM protein HpnJ [Candidatus Magnetominusculus xianensis]|uniref:Hopanoid biosynthesis associated radical SAM protein HpnJ n=2 Tax=Candidatus Magnetominusculus xianensis TaxID=1748249 RepID=A0ABR5SC10_9BACT|nr:hopanoid biosynthesis associated radical SAM protein HpnJ [Candidatus Magnetominusculus xianensis]